MSGVTSDDYDAVIRVRGLRNAFGEQVIHDALDLDVRRGEILGVVGDPYGEIETGVRCPIEGVVIGRLNLPLVHEGDAIFHVATFDAPAEAALAVGQMAAELRTLETGLEPPIL